MYSDNSNLNVHAMIVFWYNMNFRRCNMYLKDKFVHAPIFAFAASQCLFYHALLLLCSNVAVIASNLHQA